MKTQERTTFLCIKTKKKKKRGENSYKCTQHTNTKTKRKTHIVQQTLQTVAQIAVDNIQNPTKPKPVVVPHPTQMARRWETPLALAKDQSSNFSLASDKAPAKVGDVPSTSNPLLFQHSNTTFVPKRMQLCITCHIK